MSDRTPVRAGALARGAASAVLVGVLLAACAGPATAPRTAGAPASPVAVPIESLRFPPLRFDPPEPERFELSNGVTVFLLEERTLPLLELFVDLKGGYIHFDREWFGAGSALPSQMRGGGTDTIPPDTLDERLEFHALGMSSQTNGGGMVLGVSALRRQLDVALELWSAVLLRPRFDADAVERWRLRELEAVRRRGDFAGSLAVAQFNRVMFGDHPTGWIMDEDDLAPDRVSPERLMELHARLVCPERAVIGVAGAVSRAELEPALERALAGWERCGTELPEPPIPELGADPRVYVIHRPLPQSTIAMGQPGGVLMGDHPGYYASRLANWVIGGSGFTSRLLRRLRTEEGLAYSASSIWGAARKHPRIFGAIAHTRADATVQAIRLMVETLGDAVAHPPDSTELALARDAIVNGFVFGFTSPAQIVARQVGYFADGLPADWLNRYIDGVRAVTPTDAAAVLRRHIDPADFTILIVGDTTAFDVTELGLPVVVLSGR